MTGNFKADIRRDTTCAACGTGYYYFHAVEVNEEDSSKFDAKVRDAVENGVGVAPCPKCGKLNGEMWAAYLKALWGHLVGIAVSVGILLFGWMMFGGGALMYGVLLLGGLSLLGYLGAMIGWFLAPVTNRKHSILPGEENQASEDASAKLAAWQTHQGS